MTRRKDPPSNSDDILDFRDITDRFEELEDERNSLEWDVENADHVDGKAGAEKALAAWDESNGAEFKALESLLNETRGAGGDHQWRGDWYPGSAIRDSYFKDYAQELAEDVGAISRDAQWPLYCIDWDQAARDLQMDYAAVEFDGVTYWVR